MDVFDFFQGLGIDTKTHKSGAFYTKCPICHDDRRKQSSKELLVNLDTGYTECFHCGWSDHILKHRDPEEKIKFTPPPPKPQKFITPEPVFNWIVPDAIIEPKPVSPLTGRYFITWYYRNLNDKLTGAKKMEYNFHAGGFNRVDVPPLHLYTRDSGYYPCLFYERDLHSFPNATAILLESEKTAAVMRKKFKDYLKEFVYIATGGANGLTDEKAKALVGRTVLICYDCDNGTPQEDGTIKGPKGREGAQSAHTKLAGISTSYIVDIDPARNDGADLVDIETDIAFIRALRGEQKYPKELIDNIRQLNRGGTYWSMKHADTIGERLLIEHKKVFEIGRIYYDANKHEFGIDDAPLLKKVEYFLLQRFEFRRNSINRRIYYRDKSSGDSRFEFCNYNDVWRLIQHNINEFGKKVRVNITDISNLLESDFVQETNPFNDYFHSLPHWDGTDHILTLANYVETTDQPFWVLQFRKALIRMIACTYGHIENRIVMTLVQEKQETGKCLGKGTKIRMSDFSLKCVEDIQIGDQVLGIDGFPRTVMELHRGIDQMYWVRQNNALDYRVNSNHVLSLQSRPHRYGSIQGGRKVSIPLDQYLKASKSYQFNHLGYRAEFDFDYRQPPIDPYYLGLWLGDGDMNYPRIFTADTEVVEYLKELADKEDFYLSSHNQTEHWNKSRVYSFVQKQRGKAASARYQLPDKRLNRYLENMKFLGVFRNKHIPNCYKINSREVRLQVLAGIIDSDGHLNKKQKRSFEVTFKSYILASDLQFLCQTLGFRASLSKKRTTMKRKNGSVYVGEAFRVNIFGKVDEIPTKIKRKQARKTYRLSKNPLTTGIKIDVDIVDNYYGFTTDGDHLFCLEDFTVTHNSNFVSFLCPPELKDYYKEDPMVLNKDAELALASNFIWNLDELAQLNKKEISELKGILSRRTVKQRRTYGRDEENYKRIVNFWGSTNKEEFLTDAQNTRWLCFRILRINHDYNNFLTNVKKIDITKVWAQAWYLYKSGESFSLSNEERTKRDIVNHTFEYVSQEKELIMKYLTPCAKDSPSVEFVTNTEILEYLIAQTGNKLRLANENVGRAMAQLDFVKGSKQINGKTARGYYALRQPLLKGIVNSQREEPVNQPALFGSVPGTNGDSDLLF